MKLSNLFLISLLFSSQPVFASEYGNSGAQEVADVVFRDLDKVFGISFNSHSAIYIGQTDKTESIPSVPFFHKVIQMEGIKNSSKVPPFPVTEVKGIDFDNFGNFQKAHPKYYGAFTLSNGISVSLGQRVLILECAQKLKNRGDEENGDPIQYIVGLTESALKLDGNYFETKEDLSYYTGDYHQIYRMRSDAFVEYCYAAAGVPIARSQIDTPINLATMYGAAALVAMAREGKLYPNTQKNWMAAAQTENPTLTVKERSTGNEVADIAHETTLDFELQDTKSGPGLLKLHKDSYDSEYGMADFSFPIELLQNGSILTGNINPAKTFKLSAADGLSPGYYQAAVYDHAGNSSPNFNLKIPPLTAIRINSANALYDNFRGVSATAPSTLERSHSFEFSEPVAGVSAVTIDGPQGNIWAQTFDPPVFSTATVLNDLPTGNYNVRALNAVGGETSTPFKIDGLTVALSSTSSYAQYTISDLIHPGTFYFNLHVSAESTVGLGKIQLLTSTGAFLDEKISLSGGVNFDFITPELLSVRSPSPYSEYFNYGVAPNDPSSVYILRAFDRSGNTKDFRASIDAKAGSFIVRANFPDATDYRTRVYDSVEDFSLMPGSIFGNYYVNSDSEAVILPLAAMGLRPGGEFRDAAGCNVVAPGGNIGTGQFILSTWASGDGSDKTSQVVETVSLYEILPDTSGVIRVPDDAVCYYSRPENPDYAVCTSLTSTGKVLMSLMRYVQAEVIVTKPNICHDRSYIDQEGNTVARFHVPGVESEYTVSMLGFGLGADGGELLGTGNNVATGENIKLPLSSQITASFDNVTASGYFRATVINSRPPTGYLLVPKDTAFEITRDANLSFTGNANLSFKYDTTGLTIVQEQNLKLVKVVDPATGKYEELAAALDTVNKTISANVTSFSKFMVLAPEYPEPHPVRSPNTVNGAPEMEFMSGAAASLPQYDLGGAAWAGTLAALKSANKLPVGNVYSLSTATGAFEPSGAIKMRYSGGAVAGLGVDENSLAIYGFTGGGDLHKLPYLTLDKDNKVLTARVPSAAYPLFAVLASSQQVENTPPSIYPDGISPETTISFGGLTAPAPDGTYISSTTVILFSASDPQVPDVVTSGVNLTNYILNPDSGTVAISTYTGPFTLPEGANPMYYMSVDNAGNYEFPRATTIYMDATLPVTALSVLKMNLAPETSFYTTASGAITLVATDPIVNGARSGVYETLYLVDKNFSECHNLALFLANPSGQQPNFAGQPGTCENPLYTVPFILLPGTHTVQCLSIDNIRNAENPKTFYLEALGDVAPPETSLLLNGSRIAPTGTADITPETQITLDATDPNSNGIASGVKAVYYLIDVTTTSCLIPPDLTGPAGTCRNPLYSGPFTLEVGTHTVYYTAEDNAGNEAPLKSANISVWNSSVICGGTVTENTILSADLDCSAVTGVALTINADNVVLDGNNHKIIAPNAVWVVNANDRTNVTVKNVDLSGNSGLWQGTGLRISYSKGSLIENVTAHNRDVGLSIASGNNNSILRNNNLSNNRSALQVGGATMTLTGNNLSNSVVGLSAGGSNLILGNGNDFSGSTTAVVLVNLTDSVIENLTLNNPKAILGGSSKRLIFRNLDLSGLGGIGLEFNYTEDGVYENITAHNRDIGMNIAGGNSNSIIRNNNLSANKIALQVGGSSMTISGNILSNSASGLSAGGFNLVLKSDNDFSGSTAAVVLVNLTDSVIENLVLNNPKAIFGGAAKRLVFRNLDLSGTGGSGLEFNYTENSVYENIAVHNRDVGLNISAGNSNSIIRNNNLSSNRIALQVGGATMTVTGNILSNSVTGLAASGSNLVIGSGNNFSGSTTAVFLGYLTDSVIENLVLNNPKGIAGGASKRLVFRNLDLSGSGGIGLEFNYAEDNTYENITAHNRDTGLNISYGNKNSIIRNNNLSHNNTALQVTGATLTVINNKFDSSTLGLNAMDVYNLVIGTGNDFIGSTTAISIGIGEGVVLEDLVLNNPLAVNIYRSKAITLRNVNLSGPAGIAAGTGMRVSDSSNINIKGVLVANRDIGIKMDGVCTGNLVANNTVVNNNTGLLLMQPCSGVSIVNTVIWGNLDDLQDQSGLNPVSYSNVQEALLPGEGNIHADPLFVDVAAGDYRLRTGSPGIDAGTNTVAGLPVADLDGNFRIIDGNDDGNAVIDMGAYESQAMLPIINDISPSSGPVSSTFTIHGRGFGAYAVVTSRVFIGTTSASITSWTSTAIQGTVPEVLAPGMYSVVVERELNGSLVQTSSVSFTVVSIVSVSSDGLVSITTPEAKLSVTAISTETLPSTATVFSAMSGAGLEPVLGSFYELEPSGIQFTAPAKLAFTFNPVAIDTATVAIYYYDNVGLVWTSATIYNQRVTFNPDGSATVEGEIYHTSLYALLRVNPAPAPAVTLKIKPEVLNLKSEGENITAELRLGGGSIGCFDRETINISAINGQALAEPVFARERKKKEHKKDPMECGHVTVKFDREEVIAVLPVNMVVEITVSGMFADGRVFNAVDTIRTIKPHKITRREEECGEHQKRADCDVPSGALEDDTEFRLGEVYVYPNPVRGGKVPTFHIEVGAADTVKIKIYTVAGQLIHEKILTGAPQVVGAAYAYEYAWEGRIVPGIYNYAIEAGKADRKLMKGGMFAVLR